MIVAFIGTARPVTADDLVTNLSTSASGREGLADSEYIQSFTTGPNVSGYLLESISIDFFKGSVGARDPVYVYLYEDNGSGRPRSRAIATLTKNGVNFAPPVTGVNKYKVWKARCYPQPPHGGGCLQDPSSVHLAPNTTYWVYVWAGRSTTGAELQSDTATTETGAAGWTLGDSAFSKPSWGSSDGVYTYTSISAPLLIKVEGTTNPEVLVSINDVTVTEGTHKTANFVVSLSRKTSGPVQVSYGTVQLIGSSAADDGSDYEATSGTLTFRPGQTRKTVSVPILDDARNEGDEMFGLALTNLQGATFAVNNGTGTIINAVPLALSISDATATEGVDATIDFTVSLNRATTRRITVKVLFSSGTADFSDIELIRRVHERHIRARPTEKNLLGPGRRRHRERTERDVQHDPAVRGRTGRHHRRLPRNRYHPQHRDPDGQLRERPAGPRRQQRVHLQRRLHERRLDHPRRDARPRIHGHERRRDRRLARQWPQRTAGCSPSTRTATMR